MLAVGLASVAWATTSLPSLGPVEEAAPAVAEVVTTTVPTTSTSTTTTSTTTTTLPPPVFPLTGRLAPDAARAQRPAVTVKIDNVSQARPQSGLDVADVVYEEFTEGVTRLVVVFQSADAEVVGPVRSVRPADPVIVTPLGGVFAFSGGSPATVGLAQDAPVTIVTENATDVMYRRSGRFAPHNLYSSTAGILSRAPEDATPPPPLSPFLPAGAAFAAAGAVPVTHLALVPAPFLTADYDWDPASNGWLRTTDGGPHVVEGTGQLAPTNVILQFTPYSRFAADFTVQYPEVVGAGEAWFLSGGLLAKGSWSKAGAGDMTTFFDASGAPVRLQTGQTWVHLVAPGSSVSVT